MLDRELLRERRINNCLKNVRTEDDELGNPDAAHTCPGCHYVINRTADVIIIRKCIGFEESSSIKAPVRASRSSECVLHRHDYSPKDPTI